jgi:hypothetical protein
MQILGRLGVGVGQGAVKWNCYLLDQAFGRNEENAYLIFWFCVNIEAPAREKVYRFVQRNMPIDLPITLCGI